MSDVADTGGGTSLSRQTAGVFPLALGVAALVIGLDALSKRWAVSALSGDRTRHLFWTLQLELLHNPGMAFSKGRGLGPFIAIGVLVVVAILLRSLLRPRSRFYVVCVGLVVGGAIGNWLDRVFRAHDGLLSGHVVDFINFQWWPAFNVADIAVVVGALLLMFESWRHERADHQQQTSSVQA